MKKPQTMPERLANGITSLLPEDDETTKPKNCLTTLHRAFTHFIMESINAFLNINIFPDEQKECYCEIPRLKETF